MRKRMWAVSVGEKQRGTDIFWATHSVNRRYSWPKRKWAYGARSMMMMMNRARENNARQCRCGTPDVSEISCTTRWAWHVVENNEDANDIENISPSILASWGKRMSASADQIYLTHVEDVAGLCSTTSIQRLVVGSWASTGPFILIVRFSGMIKHIALTGPHGPMYRNKFSLMICRSQHE